MPKIFFDGPITLSRFDRVKYPWMRRLFLQQKGYHWTQEEVELHRDAAEFKTLNEGEQHMFTSNLKRQILLDTVQGGEPSLAFGPICSLPEFKSFLKLWEHFEENIHAESYQYILENIYPSTSSVYDSIDTIPEIQSCRTDVSKYYDDLIRLNNSQAFVSAHQHKTALWKCLHAVNFLEGIRFYVSFACSWAFAELKKMEGNAKILKLICRDENVHLAFTQLLIKALPKDDPDFVKIKEECASEIEDMAKAVADQEKDWAKYLFSQGSMLGLNAELLAKFVDHRTWKVCKAIGVKYADGLKDNPLSWTEKWISGSEVQVAPQETQQTQYTIGGINNDIKSDTFKDFVL